MAARFPDPEHASAALNSLRQELDNGVEADIAPLAADGGHENSMVLAGHFAEEVAPEVTHIVEEAGGEIVADVDASWTVPRYRRTE